MRPRIPPPGGRPQQRQAAASAAAAAEEEEVDYGLGPGSLVSQLLEGAGASAAAAAAHEYARHAASAAYGEPCSLLEQAVCARVRICIACGHTHTHAYIRVHW